MEYIVKILKIESLTPNIKRFKIEKPKNYNFISGQHTLVSVNKFELKDKKRPFSFSSSEKEDFLELIIGEPKGKISYKGNGTFIAAGTGIAPFISIIKSLNKTEHKNNLLIYSNGAKNKIILEEELKKLFNKNTFLF